MRCRQCGLNSCCGSDLEQQLQQAEARVAELNEQKHKLKWRLASQSVRHVRLHNKWVCGELKAPEEESIVNPFMYAETEVWWAIGDEADGFAKEIEAQQENSTQLRPEPKHSDAWLLRKQAEAVDDCQLEFHGDFSAQMTLSQCADSLRQQADELER